MIEHDVSTRKLGPSSGVVECKASENVCEKLATNWRWDLITSSLAARDELRLCQLFKWGLMMRWLSCKQRLNKLQTHHDSILTDHSLTRRFRLLQNFMKNAKIASPRAVFSLKFHRIWNPTQFAKFIPLPLNFQLSDRISRQACS